jgi:hypothetical protein
VFVPKDEPGRNAFGGIVTAKSVVVVLVRATCHTAINLSFNNFD